LADFLHTTYGLFPVINSTLSSKATMADREKDYLPGHAENRTNGNAPSDYHIPADAASDDALQRIRTAGSISISPELFEKLYLSPENKVKGDLRKTFGNPTPLALIGFLLSLTPLSCQLMGWRGAGGMGASDIGAYMFFGGLLMILGAVGEFFLGNTFPFVVFGTFGGFWLTYGATLTPFYNSYGAYSTTGVPADGQNAQFYASFAFFLLFMGMVSLIFFICSLRTNVVFIVIFASLVCTFSLLAAAFWQLANGNAPFAMKLQIAGGAFGFITSMAGWWILLAQMLASVDFPLAIPLGDTSTLIKGASQRKKDKGQYEA